MGVPVQPLLGRRIDGPVDSCPVVQPAKDNRTEARRTIALTVSRDVMDLASAYTGRVASCRC
jgi:hypothetical protein